MPKKPTMKARSTNIEMRDPDYYAKKRALEEKLGRELTKEEFMAVAGDWKLPPTASIFDPVLCETVYRWFCPEGGSVLDPFAGGSVRGIVAARLGLSYVGIDISARQVAANEEQAEQICGDGLRPKWIVGDSRNARELAPGSYDLVFSCPPYYDIEVYTEDERDLSQALTYLEFIEAYRVIIQACIDMLTPNRFACFVVGDIRDEEGFYRGFPAHTVAAFEEAGARLYNEAVLLTVTMNLGLRAGRQFSRFRKLGKCHQNVLVFYKGDPQAIPGNFAAEVPFGDYIG